MYFVMREHSDDKFLATIGRVCKSDPGYSDDQVSLRVTSVVTFVGNSSGLD